MRLVSPESFTIALDGRTVDQLIRAGSGDAALLYLYLLRTGGAASEDDAAGTLRKSQREIASSMEILKSLGLIKSEPGTDIGDTPARLQKEETPEYTAEDIKRELENGSVFNSLVQEVQKSLGRILSSDDLVKLFGMYDSLGLPPEVILQLVTYCADENRRRYGPGRATTMRYIEKAAFAWEREGVATLEEAERYIKALETKRGQISDIKTILQIKDRELTAGERQYVDSWLALGFSTEVVELAYERTILGAGKFHWKYMNSILGSWHQKGLRSVADIEAKDKKGPSAAPLRSTGKPAKPSVPSQADIEHMRKFIEKLREE